MNFHTAIRPTCFIISVTFCLTLGVVDLGFAKKKKSASKERSIYSSIIQVEPKKGYILVVRDSNVVWVEASKAAKPHVRQLPVGEMIDIVVTDRGGKRPPLLTRWKLASGESKCQQFDGKRCRK